MVKIRRFAVCSLHYWQTVSSRRGPIYRARIYECTHVMGGEYTYLIMWKCVFGNARIRARWIGPLLSWVNATHSRGVSWVFHSVFVDFSQSVRCIIAIRATHYYNMCNAKLKTIRNVIATCSPPILWICNALWKTGCNLFVLWLLCIQKTKRGFLQHKNPLFAR